VKPRLHHPFYAEIAMLDAVATRAERGPANIQSGFDDDFREIVVVSTLSGTDLSEKLEQPPLFIPSQIENPVFDLLQQMNTGAQLDTKLVLVWTHKDLVALDLITPTGEPLVRANDRLVSIRDKNFRVVEIIRTPPGLYVTEVRPLFGLAQRRDLFLVSFEDRKQGAS
jgi:hypothetical protein